MGETKPSGAAADSTQLGESPSIARVVLDTRVPHLDRLLDYSIPDGMDVHPGVRVRVPLGRSQKLHAGFVVGVTSDSDFSGKLNAIEEVVSPVRVLPATLWELAVAVAKRQAGSPADILRLAIPSRAVRVEKQWLGAPTTPGHTAPEIPPASPHYDPADWAGLTALGVRTALEFPPGVVPTSDGHTTTVAADTLARLAATVLADRKSVIISVPDWRERDQIRRSLLEYLPETALVVTSSDKTPSERYSDYLRGLQSEPVVVLGQRHSIFAPVPDLGLIVVVSESDESHREPLAPYQHTRDVALLRAQQEGCALVFADWMSGVDMVRLIDMGYLHNVRPITRQRPTIIPTALTTTGRQDPSPGRLPSLAYRAISEALAEGPVLVQVFRAGYAPGLACEKCRERRVCEACGGPVTAGSRPTQWACSWCGSVASPTPCPDCGSVGVAPIGHGVGRTVAELGKAFPAVPVVRSDGDHLVQEVSPKPALVVATRGAEPIASGGYRAVLLLDGDKMLQRSSLSALEETLRGWEWAASLAAPGAAVYVTDVEGPVVHAFVAGAHHDLMRRELSERRALRLPPALRVASVTGPPAVVTDVMGSMEKNFSDLRCLGPVRIDGERVRGLILFPYAVGTDVAKSLRAEVIERALTKTPASRRLRVVLDDIATLDQISQAS